jgi:hypothetical protein
MGESFNPPVGTSAAAFVALVAAVLSMVIAGSGWAARRGGERVARVVVTMAYEGQNYDIVTGVLALGMAPLAARDHR